MKLAKEYEAPRQALMIERARLVAELERRRSDTPPREDVLARDERPPIAHAMFLAEQFDRIESRLLDEVDAALGRMADGTYGVCLECGKQIETRRLQAIPWAERCFACEVMQAGRERKAA